MFSTLVGAKLAIAAVAGSLSIGGVAAAAVTGALPGPFAPGTSVSVSDSASGDPSESSDPTESADPNESDSPTPSAEPTQTVTPTASATSASTAVPVGPDATGPAAFGLCHAFGGTKAISKANNPSIAHRNLLAAATAAGQSVATYCAAILGTPLPTAAPSPTGSAAANTVQRRGHGNGRSHGRASNGGKG